MINNNGVTFLHQAYYDNNIEIVKILINHPRFEYNMLTNLRNTPFLYACSHKSYKVVKYMINDSKTQVNHFNYNYETPLHKDC